MAERKFDEFDQYAKDYREIHTKNVALSGADSYYFAEHKVKELKRFESNIDLSLLDLGCGDGITEFFIHQHFPKWICTGIDVSVKSIEEATARNLSSASYLAYNGEQIPFPEHQFDIVFVAAVLHHVDPSLHEGVSSEIRRVLKPGGRIYIFEHNPINPVTRHLVNTCEFDKDAKLLGHAYTKRLLKTSGFQKIALRFILFFPRKGWLSKLIGLERFLTWLPLGGQYFYRAIK